MTAVVTYLLYRAVIELPGSRGARAVCLLKQEYSSREGGLLAVLRALATSPARRFKLYVFYLRLLALTGFRSLVGEMVESIGYYHIIPCCRALLLLHLSCLLDDARVTKRTTAVQSSSAVCTEYCCPQHTINNVTCCCVARQAGRIFRLRAFAQQKLLNHTSST